MQAPTTQQYRRYLVNGKPFVAQADALKEATAILAEGRSADITPGFDKLAYHDAKSAWKVYTEMVVTTTAMLIQLAEDAPLAPNNTLNLVRRHYREVKQGSLIAQEIAHLERHAYNERYAMRQYTTGPQAWQRQLDLQATYNRIKHLKAIALPAFGPDHMPIVEKAPVSLRDEREAEYSNQAATTYNAPSQPLTVTVDWDKVVPLNKPVAMYCDIATRETVYSPLLIANPKPKPGEGPYEYITKGVNSKIYQPPVSIDDQRTEQYLHGTDPKNGAIKANPDRLDKQLIGKTLSYSWTPDLIEAHDDTFGVELERQIDLVHSHSVDQEV